MKTLIAIACLIAAVCQAQTPTATPDPKPEYYVTISDGWVQVWDYTLPEHYMGRVEVEKWREILGRLHDTLNDKRHMALNGVAAVVAGEDGGREHTIGEEINIVTFAEGKNKKGIITLTIERGTGFAILEDSNKNGSYRAEIMTISPKKLKEAISATP